MVLKILKVSKRKKCFEIFEVFRKYGDFDIWDYFWTISKFLSVSESFFVEKKEKDLRRREEKNILAKGIFIKKEYLN